MRLLGHRVSVLTRTQLCAQLTGQAGGIQGLLQEGTNTSCYHCLPSFLPPSLTSYLPSPQAIELDPQNENYKSNLETVEQQLKAKVVSWCVSQVVMMVPVCCGYRWEGLQEWVEPHHREHSPHQEELDLV